MISALKNGSSFGTPRKSIALVDYSMTYGKHFTLNIRRIWNSYLMYCGKISSVFDSESCELKHKTILSEKRIRNQKQFQ